MLELARPQQGTEEQVSDSRGLQGHREGAGLDAHFLCQSLWLHS